MARQVLKKRFSFWKIGRHYLIDLYLLINFLIVLPLVIIHINFFRYPVPDLDVSSRLWESVQMLFIGWLALLLIKLVFLLVIKFVDKLDT